MNSLNKGLFAIVLLLCSVKVQAVEKKAVDFSLTNWDGRTIARDDLKHMVVILTFSHAYCSVRCPVISGRLLSLDREMGSPRNVVYLHISVDPDMDTPERRLNYFNLYGIDAARDGRWLFVSGSTDDLSKLWRFYGIDISKVDDPGLPEKYYMEFTPKVVVIDKSGSVRDETNFFFSEDETAHKIQKLIREESWTEGNS